jgi:hypothetical protein
MSLASTTPNQAAGDSTRYSICCVCAENIPRSLRGATAGETQAPLDRTGRPPAVPVATPSKGQSVRAHAPSDASALVPPHVLVDRSASTAISHCGTAPATTTATAGARPESGQARPIPPPGPTTSRGGRTSMIRHETHAPLSRAHRSDGGKLAPAAPAHLPELRVAAAQKRKARRRRSAARASPSRL